MRVSTIAAHVALFAGITFAQPGPASITGTIFDKLGHMVQSAPVLVTNTQTGNKYSTETDRTGAFTFTLPRGTYSLSIEVAGVKYTQESMVVTPEHPLRHDVTLALP